MHKSELLFGLTGRTGQQVLRRIVEAEHLGLKRVTLFLELMKPTEKREIYERLLSSKIRSIPMVHIRNDMSADELRFLKEEFGAKYLTIHENSFRVMKKWRRHYRELYLEMNYDNRLSGIVHVEKIGGFCIDLSHFKSEEERWTKEFEYFLGHRKSKVGCNHLNGYTAKYRHDLHTIKDVREFSYLKTLPPEVFGKVMGLEMYNNLKEQLTFKSYIKRLLKNKVRIF